MSAGDATSVEGRGPRRETRLLSHELDAFAALAPSAAVRKDFLSHLPDHLTKYELMALRDQLVPVDFKYDIVANFPLELVALVFKHLSSTASFAFHAVSRRWKSVLNSDIIHSWAFSSVVTENDPPLVGEEHLTLSEKVKFRYLQRFAFKRLLPFSIAVLNERISHEPGRQSLATFQRITYVHGKLAWISGDSDGRSVKLHDILKGSSQEFRGEGREKISAIALSSKLLAIATYSGRCYAWSTGSTYRSSCIQLPSANIALLSARTQYVAFALRPDFGDSHKRTVGVWDFSSGSTESFVTDAWPSLKSMFPEKRRPVCWEDSDVYVHLQRIIFDVVGIIIAPDGLSVVLVWAGVSFWEQHAENYREDFESIVCIRYDLSGTVLSFSARHFPLGNDDIDKEYRVVPADNDGLFAIHLSSGYGNSYRHERVSHFYKWHRPSVEFLPKIRVRHDDLVMGMIFFDENHDSLLLRSLVGNVDPWPEPRNVLWKGIVGQSLSPDPSSPLYELSTEHGREYEEEDDQSRWDSGFTLGDDHFSVSLLPISDQAGDRFILGIHCYDYNATLPRSIVPFWFCTIPSHDEGWWVSISALVGSDRGRDAARAHKWVQRVRSRGNLAIHHDWDGIFRWHDHKDSPIEAKGLPAPLPAPTESLTKDEESGMN